MDSYYFLHTKSLCNIDYGAYKAGLTELNSLTLEMQADEKKLKSGAVYHNPLYMTLCSDNSETGAIIQFIEQCKLDDNDIDSDDLFQLKYPNKGAGFLGVNFVGIAGIASQRQVTDASTLQICRNFFLENLIKYGNDRDLPSLLLSRFPYFLFSPEALNDLLWWKKNGNGILDTVIKLLDDIPNHPYTGGIGKTEALSNTQIPVASKRITQKDRITYTFGAITTTIHRCKEHYQ